MAASLSEMKLGTFLGSISTTEGKIWYHVGSTAIANMTAAAYLNAQGASSGDSSITAGDLVICVDSSNVVGLRYVSDAGTGTLSSLG